MRYKRVIVGLTFGLCAGPAYADTIYIPLSGRTVTSVIDRIAVSDVVVLTGQVPANGTGAVKHILKFAAPSNVMRGAVNWSINGKTRFLGVNTDLVNTGNMLVVSDTFAGTLGGRTAVSTLDISTLTPNVVYLLKLTGTAVTAVNYSITLEFGPP